MASVERRRRVQDLVQLDAIRRETLVCQKRTV